MSLTPHECHLWDQLEAELGKSPTSGDRRGPGAFLARLVRASAELLWSMPVPVELVMLEFHSQASAIREAQ